MAELTIDQAGGRIALGQVEGGFSAWREAGLSTGAPATDYVSAAGVGSAR